MDQFWRLGLNVAYRCLLIYWFIARPKSRGVHVALWCGGRVLIIRNSYRRGCGLPCGGLKRGEAAAAGAVRELREEVGVSVRPEELLRVGDFISYEEYKRDRSTVFEIEFDEAPLIRPDGREVLRAEFVLPSDLSGDDLSADDLSTRPLTSIAEQYLRWKHEGRPEPL